MEVVGPIIAIAIAVVFALVCRGMAKSRNRSQNLWTVLGFFFPLISLIVLLIMFIKGFFGKRKNYSSVPVEVAATYWHFVDALWIYLLIFFLVLGKN